MSKRRTKQRPVHPGQVLKTVLEDAHVSANKVALALRIPANRLAEIINGRQAISADAALRLAWYFGTSAQMWMSLQTKFDLETAEDLLAEQRLLSHSHPSGIFFQAVVVRVLPSRLPR